MGARRCATAVGAAALVAALGACGGGDEEAASEVAAPGAGAPAAPDNGASGTTVPALDYVSGVCTSLIGFGTAVEAEQAALEEDLPAITTVEEGKELLSTFARALAEATTSMVDGIRAAGAPDIPDGERVATTALEAFSGVEAAMSDLQPQIDGLSADFESFPTEAAKVLEAAGAAFDDVGAGLDELETPELDEVSETAPACADL